MNNNNNKTPKRYPDRMINARRNVSASAQNPAQNPSNPVKTPSAPVQNGTGSLYRQPSALPQNARAQSRPLGGEPTQNPPARPQSAQNVQNAQNAPVRPQNAQNAQNAPVRPQNAQSAQSVSNAAGNPSKSSYAPYSGGYTGYPSADGDRSSYPPYPETARSRTVHNVTASGTSGQAPDPMQATTRIPTPDSMQATTRIPTPDSMQATTRIPTPDSMQATTRIPTPDSMQATTRIPTPDSMQATTRIPTPTSAQQRTPSVQKPRTYPLDPASDGRSASVRPTSGRTASGSTTSGRSTAVRPASERAASSRPSAGKTGSSSRAVRTTDSKTPAARSRAADKAKNRRTESSGGDNPLSSIIKAMIYIVFVLVVSGFLSYYIIVIANDVFAFVKEDDAITISLDEYATTKDLSLALHDKGVIQYPYIFQLYAKFRHHDDDYLSGEFTVSPSMNYDDLIYACKPRSAAREQISITIREGLTINEIIDVFVDRGIGTREGFIDVIENHEFDYWFLNEMTNVSTYRTYRLEGYLYPDTYYFYTDSSEYAVIKKFLDRFNEMFDERYKESCAAVGMTVDDVITLASIIQMEAKYVSEYGAISSVFHNRLNHPSYETAGFLNSDATIQYALNERKSVLTSEDTELDSPYNTYTNKGLPPGPICNPSLDAINYAMYPDDTDYYYFVSRRNGYSFFAHTAEEHAANIIAARAGE